MTDRLILSTPKGDAEAGKIASALQTAEDQKRIKQLEKNIADLKQLQADKDKAEQASKQPPAANKIGARKSGDFKAVSTAPSINKTPMGNSTPPIPYPTTQDLSNSVAVAHTVKFNGDPAYTLDRTTQPSGKGDDGGSAKGVKSGTVNGEVKPTKASGTVRAEGKHVVREGDPNTMNDGNNPGIYTTTQTPSDAPPKSAAATSNPPVQLETPNEKSAFGKWWDNAKHEMGQAVEHPWEGIKGAAKGIANIPSDIGEMLMKGSALQGAGEMEQAAAMQSLFGQTKQAEGLLQAAGQVREGAGQIALPKLAMSNPAQAGGDKISTAVQLFAGGAGLVKSGAKGVSTLGKAGGIAETAGAAGKTAGAADAVGGAGKATEAAGTLDKTAEATRTASGTTEAAGGAAKGTEATKTADAANDAGKTGQAVEAEAKPAGDGVKIIKQERLKPGTPAHKADRWKKYQERGGKKDYDEWSKQYDTNMRNYQYGAAREVEYRSAMEASEGTLKTPLTNRQIDILKTDEIYAGQLKTGPVSLTKENVLAIQKDAELVKRGWQVEHILEKGASKPYLEALEKAGINYHIGPKIP